MKKINKKILVYTKNGKEYQFDCIKEFSIIAISITNGSLLLILFNYLFEFKLKKLKD